MTDIGGGIFSLVLTAIFLRFWKPRHEWHFNKKIPERGLSLQNPGSPADSTEASKIQPRPHEPKDKLPVGECEVAAAEALVVSDTVSGDGVAEPPLSIRSVSVAWGPYALMSVLLLLTGLVRQQEGRGPVFFGPIQTNYMLPVPALHNECFRDGKLVSAEAEPKPEKAEFNLAWLTAPGSAVFVAAVLSMAMLRMKRAQIGRVLRRTVFQMKIPIPTIACMLGLSYVTRYAGMDATLGVAFAESGVLYPFFAAILGWLGVFLTGTDAGSNALFGSLQKITATEIFKTGAFSSLASLTKAQVLICTANSTGGVMGKMIDAQSICVATAATHQIGREADIFKAVIWHSMFLAAIVGLLTLIQAYVWPFTLLVPG
jgi:lactate permease